MTEEASVRITLPKIYDEMVEMKEGFADLRSLLQEHIAVEGQRNLGVEQRLENHGTRLSDQGTQIVAIDGRVTQLESTQRTAKERETRRATWPQIVTSVVAVISGASLLIGLLFTLSKLAEVIAQLP